LTGSTVAVAMAQLNFTVGDIAGNARRITEAAIRARDELGCQAILFPELAISGYPPEDLLLRDAFVRECERCLHQIAGEIGGITALVGHPERAGPALFNSASVIADGQVRATYRKHHLPNYSVFDEKRYFSPGDEPCVVDLHGLAAGVVVCEDLWSPGPLERAVERGARVILDLNASPWHRGKSSVRESHIGQCARERGVPVLYCNLLGGQDELVFDGSSFVVDAEGRVTTRAAAFIESMPVVRLGGTGQVVPEPGEIVPCVSEEESVYGALVLGVRDYIDKNGFPGAVVGLSGGIDSALTLAVAADAIGPDRLEGVLMPSRYTSPASLEDAVALAENLGVRHSTISIEPMFERFLEGLRPHFGNRAPDSTEENIQARCRGVLLMAISNKTGAIVLTTGNKSEMSVGYATLYGDMAGGFAAIQDVPKLLVYRLSRWRNSLSPVIPERTITREPTAELAADQKDSDSLPPYEVLDPILERYIEDQQSPEEIAAAGFDEATVRRIVGLVDRNEYKRRQAAPGVKISRLAFGRDRRYPLTSGFRHD